MSKKIFYMLFMILIVICGLASGIAQATAYYVDPNGNDSNDGQSWEEAFKTIQTGLDSANDNDTIDVNVGTYYETIDFNGVSCILRGTDPNDWDVVGATVIDANGQGYTVTLGSGVDANAVFEGFTVKGATYAGVLCVASSPTIRKCIIENNIGSGAAGVGTTAGVGSPLITGNIIRNNTAAGVVIGGATTPVIKNNFIYDSMLGIYCCGSNAGTEIRNNTIVRNSMFGIYDQYASAPTISNCIIWDCNDDLYNCSATYSCIEDGDSGEGNISGNPSFVNADANNFHLDTDSPCINKGDPNGNYSGEIDIDGEDRVLGSRVDMGADETIYTVYNITREKWYSSIGNAISDANNGDEIVASEGTYQESIDFSAKAITITGTNPDDWDVVAATIIDATGFTNGVEFESGENGNSVLKGFTVMNATSAGVFINDGSPVITQCILQGNDAGADYRQNSVNTVISRCKIKDNTSYGIYGQKGNANIKNNLIYDNPRGMKTTSGASAVISNNTFVSNDFYGIEKSGQGQLTISNCIVWDCNDDLQRCSATYSCIEDGDSGTGNYSFYPFFEDYANNDFHITKNSPCVDSGDPNFTGSGQTDIDGDSRVIDSRVDIGADELNRTVNLVKNADFQTVDPEDSNAPQDWLYYEYGNVKDFPVGCYDGNNVKLTKAMHPVCEIKQTVGTLIPSEEYEISVRYNTSTIHTGCARIVDTDWKDADGNKGTWSYYKYHGTPHENGIGDWMTMTGYAIIPMVDDYGESTADHNIAVYVPVDYTDDVNDPVWYDDVNVTLSSMFLPAYGPVNEPNIAETVEFGTPELNTDWVSDINDTSIISGSQTDPCDNNIKYRKLKLGKSIVISFPAFNLDPYDANFPATPMLLEVMLKDEPNTNGSYLSIYSGIDYGQECDDPCIAASAPSWESMDYYLVYQYNNSGIDKWKYIQVPFQLSDFTLLRAVDGYFKIKLALPWTYDLPIDYVSLRAISEDDYWQLADKQTSLYGFHESPLPTDQADANYADSNITVFVRDLMHPVYDYTAPAANEPNSISVHTALGELTAMTFSIYSENGVDDLTFEISDLNNTAVGDDSNIPAADMRLFEVINDEKRLSLVFSAGSYGFVADRLDELTGSISIDANTSQRFMLKAEVPSNITGGLYTGQIDIKKDGSIQKSITVDVNVLALELDRPECIHYVYYDPYYLVHNSDTNAVFKLYRETGFDPFIICGYPNGYQLKPIEDANGNIIDWDVNDFNNVIHKYIEEGFAKEGSMAAVQIFKTADQVRKACNSPAWLWGDPNLYFRMDANEFSVPFKLAVQHYLDVANDVNMTFIFAIRDEPGSDPWSRILCDRTFSQIQSAGGQTVVRYWQVCNEELDVSPPYNTPNDINIPAMTDIVDHMIAGIDNFDDANYPNWDGYGSSGVGYLRNPVYNRLIHGYYAFKADANIVEALMDEADGDLFNAFDSPVYPGLLLRGVDYLLAYPTWDGEFMPTMACEGIREGIQDLRYTTTLQNLIDEASTPWSADVNDANDYLTSVKDRIQKFTPNYQNKADYLGFYQPILKDLSDSNDPNEFEVFTTIRETIGDHINTIK